MFHFVIYNLRYDITDGAEIYNLQRARIKANSYILEKTFSGTKRPK